MSTKRKRAKRGNYSRREQRQVTLAVTLLFTLSVAAIAMMAVVNRLPIGRRYTYTEASDLWIRDGGEMQIAAPELILYTLEPTPTPTPTPGPTPTPTASPELTLKLEGGSAAEDDTDWEADIAPESDTDWGADPAAEDDIDWETFTMSDDDMGWESFEEPEADPESETSPEETFIEPDAAPSPTSGFPLPEGT